MKKLLASLMALSMVFAVTGCSESNDSENESKAEAKGTYENDVYTSDLYTFKID